MSSIKQVANDCQLNDKILHWQLSDTAKPLRNLLQLDRYIYGLWVSLKKF